MGIVVAPGGATPVASDDIGVRSPPKFKSVVGCDTDVVRGREGMSRSSTSDHVSEVGVFVVLEPDSRHSYCRKWLSVEMEA